MRPDMQKKINSTTIRQINAGLVFHGIREAPHISPQALSRATGVDPGTISIILSRFERDGLVRRTVSAPTGRSGRPGTLLAIDEDALTLAGIAVGVEEILLVLTSLTGTRLASLRLPACAAPDQAVRAMKTGLTALLKQAKRPHRTLAAAGVCLPGLVGLDGRLALAPGLGWRDIDLGAALHAALRVPVRLENDTQAAGTAEHLFGSGGQTADFVYLFGHTGLGGGLYLGGATYRGPHGMAGEIGHMKLFPDGRPCACGAKGCFEAYVSEHALLLRLQQEGIKLSGAEAMRSAAAAGEKRVLAVLAQAGEHLGLGLSSLANIFTPSRIILGGSLAVLADFLLPAARPVFAANTLAAIARTADITTSSLGPFAVPMGGIAVALQRFLEEL